MIYRKWSLLTGPVAILGGIVGTVVVAHFIFYDNDRFLKPKPKNADASTSSKFGSCIKKRNVLADCKSALPFSSVMLAKNSVNHRGVRCNGISLHDASSFEAGRTVSRK
ncbi:hypothetical protein TB1_000862 [Malus domestica]